MKEREHAGIIHLLPSGIGEGQLPGRHQFQLLRIAGRKKSWSQRCALAVESQTGGRTNGRGHLQHHDILWFPFPPFPLYNEPSGGHGGSLAPSAPGIEEVAETAASQSKQSPLSCYCDVSCVAKQDMHFSKPHTNPAVHYIACDALGFHFQTSVSVSGLIGLRKQCLHLKQRGWGVQKPVVRTQRG